MERLLETAGNSRKKGNLLLGAYRQVRLGNKDGSKAIGEVFALFRGCESDAPSSPARSREASGRCSP